MKGVFVMLVDFRKGVGGIESSACLFPLLDSGCHSKAHWRPNRPNDLHTPSVVLYACHLPSLPSIQRASLDSQLGLEFCFCDRFYDPLLRCYPPLQSRQQSIENPIYTESC